jgi:hypothetical protein
VSLCCSVQHAAASKIVPLKYDMKACYRCCKTTDTELYDNSAKRALDILWDVPMLKASILSDRYASGRTLTVGYESLWGTGCYSMKSIAQCKELSVCLRNVTPAIREAFLEYMGTYDPQSKFIVYAIWFYYAAL